jgi:hypothetical protein
MPGLLLHCEFEFPLGVFEGTLLAQHLGPGLLRLAQLRAVGGEKFLQVSELPIPFTKIIRQSKTRLLCFALGDAGAFGFRPGRDLFVDSFARLGAFGLRLL